MVLASHLWEVGKHEVLQKNKEHGLAPSLVGGWAFLQAATELRGLEALLSAFLQLASHSGAIACRR